MKKNVIIAIIPQRSSFINVDIKILEDNFDLKLFYFNHTNPKKIYMEFIKQLFFLFSNIGKAKSCVCFFSGYHSLLPALIFKIFGKKISVIPAGTDCCSFPSFNYGNFRKPILGWFTSKTYLLSSQILPVHKSLMFQKDTYYRKDFDYQGINFFVKNLKVPFHELNYGYDYNYFKPNDQNREKNSFITIGGDFDSKVFAIRKGLDLIVEVSRKFPNSKFYIVGSSQNVNFPSNIICLPKTNQNKLIELLSSKEFYLQISIMEGFPNALAEAMLCGCIPIGSSISAIPEIIADTGFIVQKRDINLLEETIKIALNSNKEELSAKARKRIIDNFPLEKRKKELLELV